MWPFRIPFEIQLVKHWNFILILIGYFIDQSSIKLITIILQIINDLLQEAFVICDVITLCNTLLTPKLNFCFRQPPCRFLHNFHENNPSSIEQKYCDF